MWDLFCAVALIGAIAAGNIWANRRKIASGYYDQPKPAEPEEVTGGAETGLFTESEAPDIWHDINYSHNPGNIYHISSNDD